MRYSRISLWGLYEVGHQAGTGRLFNVKSPKRGRNERQGVHAWHPYYAGYSEGFVLDTLQALHADSTSVVLDPWNGSGTTTLVCQREGIRSIGFDINPVMVIFARAKTFSILARRDELLERVGRILAIVPVDLELTTEPQSDLQGWVPNSILRGLISLRNAILDGHYTGTDQYPTEIDVDTSFLLAALFQVLRQVGDFGSGSNPTWVVRNDEGAVAPPMDQVLNLFRETVSAMLAALEQTTGGAKSFGPTSIAEGDSRSLPLESNSVDLVITSPPYCTRIDYAVSTKPELLLLGLSEATQFDRIRRQTMGAPVITDKTLVPLPDWGQSCLGMLSRVAEHQSKAAKSYYLPNLLQYFRDAYTSLSEVVRVLRPGGSATIVVQSSYFKDIEIPLGKIYVEMGINLGCMAEIARREVVRQHMAHVNTNSSKYVADKVFYEDVVLLTK